MHPHPAIGTSLAPQDCAGSGVSPGHRRPDMYFLVPLLAPLALLGVMGMAWIEDHLLPPAEPPPQFQALPVPARAAPPADPPKRPQAFPRYLRDPAPGLRAAARDGQGADRRRPPARAHQPATAAPATAGATASARRICPSRHQPAATVPVDGDATVLDPQATDRQGQPAASSVSVSAEPAAPHRLPREPDDTPRA
jgi:hypothetical protein